MVGPSKTLRLLYGIADAANEARAPEDVLTFALDEVCAYMDWPIGHAYVERDVGSGVLVSAGLWHLDEPDSMVNFREITRKTSFSSGVGLPGRVFDTGEPVWIQDVNEDPNFPRAKESGEALGVRSAFAFPILIGRNVAAVLEFFSENVEEMSDDLLDVMARVGMQLGRVIERARAEEALKGREEYTKAILENLADGVLIMDEDGTLQSVNAAAERVFQATASDLMGNFHPLIQPGGKGSGQGERFGTYLAKNKDSFLNRGPMEVKVFRRDGTVFPLELLLSSFGPKGVRGLICAVRDISDRKETERQLLHSQRMEALGQMTSGIAHDFNNVLTAVLGNMQIVEGLAAEKPQILERARAAINAGERAADTTRRLLAFARQQAISPELVEVNSLISETITLVRKTFSSAITIKTNLIDIPLYASVDRTHLENAIINFAVNARDALDDGGTITVRTSVTSARGANKGDKDRIIVIEVEDNGCGISQENLDKVVEPFFTTKDVGKGTGLGLSTVYGFTKQAGGDLILSSDGESGTTVRLLLPLDEKTEFTPKIRTKEERPLPTGGERILVVEDDAFVRDYAVAVLRGLGYQVVAVDDGVRALNHLKGGFRADLVFSDVVMPRGVTGWHLAEKIHTEWPDIKVLMATGWAAEAGELRNSPLGVDPLLTKPYGREELAFAVRQVLDGEKGE